MAREVSNALMRFEGELASLLVLPKLDGKSNKSHQNGLVSGPSSIVSTQQIERAAQSKLSRISSSFTPVLSVLC